MNTNQLNDILSSIKSSIKFFFVCFLYLAQTEIKATMMGLQVLDLVRVAVGLQVLDPVRVAVGVQVLDPVRVAVGVQVQDPPWFGKIEEEITDDKGNVVQEASGLVRGMRAEGVPVDSSCFQWTTSSPADGAVIQACIREKVSFPWEFSTSADEILDNVQWHKRTGNEDTLIAMYAADIFLPIAPVEFLPNAGITISNHTFEDFGTFSVKVIYRQQETLFSVSRSAVLELPDAPVINGNRLMAHVQREPVTNVTTGEKHVQLTCGKFLGLGSRPVSVVWRTPSGETVPSTSFSHGEFHLTLPNPVVGGSYVCRLEDPSFAARCVKNMSALRRGAHLVVDEVQTRLLLLEDGVQGLQDKDQAVDDELERLEEKDANLTSRDEQLQGELLLQEKTDEKIKTELKRQEDVDTNLKLRDVNLTSEVADLRQDLASDKYCQALHGKLAEIGSEEENEFVEQLARQGGRNVWLGGTDAESEGSWVWDSSGNALQFANWFKGEPNNRRSEDCLHMWVSHDYTWNDIVCDNEMYFICEGSLASHMLRYENLQDAKMNKLELLISQLQSLLEQTETNWTSDIQRLQKSIFGVSERSCRTAGWDGFQSSCYKLVENAMTWAAAKDHCKSLDGKLAEIESLEENEFVKQLARQGESAWLGGHDPESDGSWVWDVSGNSIPLQSGDWGEGEPSGNGICLQLRKAQNYTWDDVDCDYKLQFVCEISVE
nr:hypothetical protein BaRGS_009578 [Batillaria attramentaria]